MQKQEAKKKHTDESGKMLKKYLFIVTTIRITYDNTKVYIS